MKSTKFFRQRYLIIALIVAYIFSTAIPVFAYVEMSVKGTSTIEFEE